jgi:hypothetical protein
MEPDRSAPEKRYSACLGKYQILGHIASGGMGTVYKARDPDTDATVALKVLPPELLAGKPALLERLRREAQVGIRLRHENIVTLYELGEAGGTYFLVMEFVEGIDLSEHVQRHGPLTPDEARSVLVQVARALDYAHRQGVVHRDIKPANLLLTRPDGRFLVKLVDLGLARQAQQEDFRLTREGYTVGTVDYLAPEQARDSGLADIRSDLYALGCTLYHLLTGTPPFNRGSLTERIYKHAEAEPPDVRDVNPDVPADLVRVLRKLLAKQPADRYQTPIELLTDLGAGAPPRRRPAPALPMPRPQPKPAAPRPAAAKTSRDTPTALRRAPKEPKAAGAVTIEARRAAEQFLSARGNLARGNLDYGITLLLGCCRLDPGNLSYHRALQRASAVRPSATPHGDGLLARLRGLTDWVRLTLARLRGDHARVLICGAEILTRYPDDLATQTRMAEAAMSLGRDELALWLLEQARAQDKTHVGINRDLARLHERRAEYTEALAYWDCVARAAPDDVEAVRKLRDLAALETLQKKAAGAEADEA